LGAVGKKSSTGKTVDMPVSAPYTGKKGKRHVALDTSGGGTQTKTRQKARSADSNERKGSENLFGEEQAQTHRARSSRGNREERSSSEETFESRNPLGRSHDRGTPGGLGGRILVSEKKSHGLPGRP